MQALLPLVLSLLVSYCSFSHADQTATIPQTSEAVPSSLEVPSQDTDFTFLAAEEPEEGTEDTQDEELLVEHLKKKTKELQHQRKKKREEVEARAEMRDRIIQSQEEPSEIPTLSPTHEKSEDVESDLLVSPMFSIKKKNGEFTLSGRFRPEGFFGKNLSFLNDRHDLDATFLVRHTADIIGDARFGRGIYGYDAAQFKFTLRNKGVWGNAASINPTTITSVKDIDAYFGAHQHSLPRFLIWFREIWLKTSLNAAFNSDFELKQYFTLGFYPFKLGHGIALGEAYATNPGVLGFYTDNAIDQYAPGFLFTGEIIKNRWDYNFYGAILENKSDSFSNVAEAIYSQRCGRRTSPARGFGHVNWLLAGNFETVLFENKRWGKLEFEPYWLFNRIPELKIEFPADAKADVATVGFDFDYQCGNFQASFECARNFGKGTVFCWDRNTIITQLDPITGAVVHADSHVIDTTITSTPNNARDIPANQKPINAQLDAMTSCTNAEALNCQLVPGTLLQNKADRFSNQFNIALKGWMMVGDIGYWILDKQLLLTAAAGIASGDENPTIGRENPKLAPADGEYEGFIGLQELFNGTLVESVYVLGQRKLPRPLSLPNDAIENDAFASTVSEFSNLVYVGTGFQYKPNWRNKFSWRPNLLFYWQQRKTHAFNLQTRMPSSSFARNFLGTEVNSFVDVFPLESLRLYFVGSIFVPGGHYKDIRGLPFNRDQLKVIQTLDDDADVDLASLPLLWDDIAYSINLGMEFKF